SGLDRVTDAMAAGGEEMIARPAADVLVVPDGDLAPEAAEVARICRAVRSVAVDYDTRSLKAKMRSADKSGAKWVVILMADDAQRRTAKLRDMSTREQVELEWTELPTRIA
ncbi:MAG TPA: His/Gly/Thr/Pro-type tRNA ligase C-terminal domain-containing protein, partial [Candidatus Dormibacteraeota bacterium]|nr:His/Gly/Thr/Pro-type tRNA ligase C-terminal domain-containing protein [Candidatus Dormibacteraeota bacterium]